jgi:hypothetical protein
VRALTNYCETCCREVNPDVVLWDLAYPPMCIYMQRWLVIQARHTVRLDA